MTRLLLADPFPAARLADLRALGLEVDYQPDLSAETLPAAAAHTAILVVRSTKVTRATLEAASALALVVRAGAGVDTIDVDAASERGVLVANCPGKNSDAVAELAMGLLLAVDRRIADGTADLARGQWNKKEYSKAQGLKGSTLGIAGFGQIGQGVAQRARAFGMNVVAWSHPFTREEAAVAGVGFAETLDELARRSDAVTVHMPQTKETKGLFGEAFFSALKTQATFINTSRGGLVDHAAMEAAMRTRGLRVGLDVYEGEPAEGKTAWDLPLAKLPGFVGTHHIGASTEQAQNAIAGETVRICREFLATGAAPNVVNVALHATAIHQLVVRHYDRVGVLAAVLGIIKNHGINVEEMNNTVFQGGKAAVASLRLSVAPPSELVREISGLKEQVIAVDVKGG
jgi:D-3-phosphoglycerate dehydrogenase / 2-oxoglutarate reductase